MFIFYCQTIFQRAPGALLQERVPKRTCCKAYYSARQPVHDHLVEISGRLPPGKTDAFACVLRQLLLVIIVCNTSLTCLATTSLMPISFLLTFKTSLNKVLTTCLPTLVRLYAQAPPNFQAPVVWRSRRRYRLYNQKAFKRFPLFKLSWIGRVFSCACSAKFGGECSECILSVDTITCAL